MTESTLTPITIPGTDLVLPRLVLGTMTFGAPVDVDTARTMVDAVATAAVTMIDTANGYSGGESERIVGQVLAGRRDDFTVATKAGISPIDSGDRPLLSADALRDSVNGSLARLGTDRIDVFYLHQPDRSTPIAETVATLGSLIGEGKIRYWGVSNFASWQVEQLRTEAVSQEVALPVVTQPLYNLIARRIEDEYAEFTATAGLVNIVYNPLAGGLLTGKHSVGEQTGSGRFGDANLGAMYRERYWNAELFAAVEALSKIAAGAGLSLVELSLRWLLGRPETGAVLLGGSRLDHLTANIEAAQGGPLPEDVAVACDDVWQRLYGPAPTYNR